MRIGWAGKVAFVAAIPVVVGVIAFQLVTLDRYHGVALENIQESIASEALVCAHALEHVGIEAERTQVWSERVGRDIHARVTVIDGSGRVVADTEATVATMENHGQRPEVVMAREKGVGVVSRHSHTVGRELLYAAAKVPGSDAVVRVARDLSGIHAELRRPTQGAWFVAFAVFAIGMLGAVLFARGLARPLHELTAAARKVEGGDLTARVFPRGNDEMAVLGHTFNRMTQELKETLTRVEAEAARLNIILEGMTEGVIAVDGAERISFLNGTARRILGTDTSRRLEGTPIYELVREPRILGLVEMASSGRKPAEGEITHEGPPRRMIQVTALPVGDSGTIIVLRDMSRLRRLEQMRSDFVSNVSHELRTPLASIAAAVETLRDAGTRADPEDGPRFLDMIRRNLERLEALLNDILALSRLESRPETLPKERVDFGGVVRVAGEELEDRARRADVALRVRTERCPVLGDAPTLRRIVDNLVVNALNYTPAGGSVDVELVRGDGAAELRVQDTGIGIPQEDLDRIFERFYRVDKARSRSAGGTGLGLAIVKHAVGLHGGTIEVESELTRGTTFTVRIPLEPEPAHATPKQGEPST